MTETIGTESMQSIDFMYRKLENSPLAIPFTPSTPSTPLISCSTLAQDEKKSTKESKIPTEITFENVGDHVGKADKDVKKFFRDQSTLALITTLSVNEKLSTDSYKCISKELTSRWLTIKKSDIEVVPYEVVKIFLSTKEYDSSTTPAYYKDDLEDFLGRLIYYYFNKHKRSRIEDFKELFDMLQLQLVSLRTLSYIVSLDICKTLQKSDPTFSARLVDIFAFIGNDDPITQTSRLDKKFVQELIPVPFNELDIGQRYDIQDKNSKWYVGRIIAKQEKDVTVSFDGWDEAHNESIVDNGQFNAPVRVSVFGSMTNGISHLNVKDRKNIDCPCVSCVETAKKKKTSNSDVDYDHNKQISVNAFNYMRKLKYIGK
jgi:hypothetical protein